MNNLIGQTIKELRKELNQTQGEFAGKIDISRSNLSQIEHGKTMPTCVIFKKIVNIFNVDANHFFVDNYKEKEAKDIDNTNLQGKLEQLEKYASALENQLKDKERIIELMVKNQNNS